MAMRAAGVLERIAARVGRDAAGALCHDGMSAKAVAAALGTTRSKALALLLTAQDKTGNGTHHSGVPGAGGPAGEVGFSPERPTVPMEKSRQRWARARPRHAATSRATSTGRED
ncbi:hypothetical protein ACH4U5_09300 [Streptomyces sp. NPDC020858]|uniref:hypothetical protein n=1 Tax=Streptomyces sp. NPDC020858 TaxID=3365097 RepID=UPI00379E2272